MLRRVVTLAMIAGLPVAAMVIALSHALAVGPLPSPALAPERASWDARQVPVSVPLHRIGGFLVVDVAVGEGPGTVPMLLDTGAHTMIDRQLADRLGAVADGRLGTVSATGHRASLERVTIPRLRVGGVTFEEVVAVVDEVVPGHPVAVVGGRGIIGANVMEGAVWQIDQAASRLTIAASSADLDHVTGAIALDFVPTSPSSPSPLVTANVHGVALHLLVDTGSNGPIVVHPATLADAEVASDALGRPTGRVPSPCRTVPSRTSAVPSRTGTGLSRTSKGGSRISAVPARTSAVPSPTGTAWSRTGSVASRAGCVVVQLALGGRPARKVELATSEVLIDGLGIMGNDFLSRFVLTIDWPQRRLYLDPIPLVRSMVAANLDRWCAWRRMATYVIPRSSGGEARPACSVTSEHGRCPSVHGKSSVTPHGRAQDARSAPGSCLTPPGTPSVQEAARRRRSSGGTAFEAAPCRCSSGHGRPGRPAPTLERRAAQVAGTGARAGTASKPPGAGRSSGGRARRWQHAGRTPHAPRRRRCRTVRCGRSWSGPDRRTGEDRASSRGPTSGPRTDDELAVPREGPRT